MGVFQHWYWNTPIDRHWLTALWPGFSPSWFRHLNMFSYGSSWILAQSQQKTDLSSTQSLNHSAQSLSKKLSSTQQKTQLSVGVSLAKCPSARGLLPTALLVIASTALALALVAPHWDPRTDSRRWNITSWPCTIISIYYIIYTHTMYVYIYIIIYI